MACRNVGTARADFWWFALAVAMLLVFAQLLAEVVGPLPLQMASLLVLVPWIAVWPRRREQGSESIFWFGAWGLAVGD